MNALTQYLDLYREHAGLIDSNSAPAMNALRPEAAAILKDTTLPKADYGIYQNCDLSAMLAPDYGLNIARIDIDVNPAATFHCDVPKLGGEPFVVTNDIVNPSSPALLPEGVYAGSMREFAQKNPDLFASFYGKAAAIDNPIVALDTMLVQDGFLLYIPKGLKIEKPLQLVNILQNGAPLMAVRRLLIILEEEAEAKLLVCDHTQNPQVDFLALETVEIFADHNSRFDYYALEESSALTHRISALYCDQKQGSKVVINGMTLYNGTTRNEYYCRLQEPDAELHLLGLGIEDEKRRVSSYSRISHDAPHCKSDELFRFTADDEARAAFIGRIFVAPGAVGTEAYQSNRNLLGSDTARIESMPELEIYNDDVKCSHGSAVGQLDPLQLFYMRTRGISEDTARLLLKQAFMADIIDGIAVETLRDRLHILVERRFSGASSACASCAGCNSHKE